MLGVFCMYIYVYGKYMYGEYMEKEMKTHSRILAWKIPQTEEPGGLLSMGSQEAGLNWATKQQQQYIYIHVIKT